MMNKKNRRSGCVRWTQAVYDLIILAVVAAVMLFVYGGYENHLSWELGSRPWSLLRYEAE